LHDATKQDDRGAQEERLLYITGLEDNTIEHRDICICYCVYLRDRICVVFEETEKVFFATT